MDKIVINPKLLAALEHYAHHTYSVVEPTIYIHTDSKGHQTPWTVEQTCKLALKILEEENLNLLKLKTLQEGLKYYRFHDLYKKIMGETLY